MHGSPRDNDHTDQDLEEKSSDGIHGPSQADIDRSWEGYETGDRNHGSDLGPVLWKTAVIGVSLVVLVSLLLMSAGPLLGRMRNKEPVQPDRTYAEVLRVIDARTFVVASGDGERTVRMIGVEAPLFGDIFHNFSQEVTHGWIAGQEVLLESDLRDSDEQGRLLRYVYLDSIMVNAALILNGLGRAKSERPNVRYDLYLSELEQRARESEVGIWDPVYSGEEPGESVVDETEASERSRKQLRSNPT